MILSYFGLKLQHAVGIRRHANKEKTYKMESFIQHRQSNSTKTANDVHAKEKDSVTQKVMRL